MKRKTVFSIFLGLFLLGCVLPLLAELLLRGGLLHPYAWLYQLLNRAGLPLIFCGLGGTLTLPVMGKASRRGRHFYRVVGIGPYEVRRGPAGNRGPARADIQSAPTCTRCRFPL